MNIILIVAVVSVLYIVISLLDAKKDHRKIIYKNRAGESIVEKVPGEFWLKWLYTTSAGDIFLNTLIKRKFISEYYGLLMNKENSTGRIDGFVKEFDIDMSQFVEQDYKHFNDFFYRKIKNGAREINLDTNTVVSPSDGKIIVLENISEDGNYFIKGDRYSLKEHFANHFDYKKFEDGSAVIVRLAPADYHRFHFPVDGEVSKCVTVEGDYFSVSPIAVLKNLRYFFMNKRTLTNIKTENFGEIMYSDIGATMVGSIIQTFKEGQVKKADEKGYFAFGGSSIILFFQKDKVVFEETILKNSRDGYETLVKMGEAIAYKK